MQANIAGKLIPTYPVGAERAQVLRNFKRNLGKKSGVAKGSNKKSILKAAYFKE